MGVPDAGSRKLARRLSKKLGRDPTPAELAGYEDKKAKAAKRKSEADPAARSHNNNAEKAVAVAAEVKVAGQSKKRKTANTNTVLASAATVATPEEAAGDLSDFEYDEREVPRDPNARTLPKADNEGAIPGAKAKDSQIKRADGLFPCKEFAKAGSCKFGDRCRFSHLAKGETLSEEAQAILQRRQRKRNAVCLTFQDTGECAYGDKCRYKHVARTAAQVQQRLESDRLIAECLQGKDSQEDKLKRIMGLPEDLRQKARAIFFAKQRSTGFGSGGNKNKNKNLIEKSGK